MSKKPKPFPPMEYIIWADAFGVSANWEEKGDLSVHPINVHSIGFVVHENNRAIVVAPHLTRPKGGDQMCGSMTIPVAAIKMRRKIERPNFEPEETP